MRQSSPILFSLVLASLQFQPASGVFQKSSWRAPQHGLHHGDDDEQVLVGNGDDLPGFGLYRTRGRQAEGMDILRLEQGHELRPTLTAQEKRAKRSQMEAAMPKPSAAVKRFLFFLSIIIAFCGSTLTVMGMVLQKYAHEKMMQSQDDSEAEEVERHEEGDAASKAKCNFNLNSRSYYLLNWRWLFGLAIFGVGNAVTWVALGMGPNSVLACFNSWNIIFAMVVAPMWFGEHVPTEAKLSACVLIAGCIWVTIVGPRSYRLHTIDSINMLFARFPFTLCCIICLTILVAAKIKHFFWQGTRTWPAAAAVQITSMASIFACYAVLFSKCTSMLVQSSVVSNVSQIGYWQFYVWVSMTVICGVCQVYFLNESLKHSSASFVIPAYESMGMSLQIIVGGIFFREYRKFDMIKHLTFWPGVILVLSGLICLTRSVAPSNRKSEPESALCDGQKGS